MNRSQFPRMFAYTSLILMLSALYYVLTYGFYSYIGQDGFEAILVWLGLVITIGSVNFQLSKRFSKKSDANTVFPYIMAVLFVIPLSLQILFRPDDQIVEMQPVLFSVIFFSSVLGAYFGVSRGKIARVVWLNKMQEKQKELENTPKSDH